MSRSCSNSFWLFGTVIFFIALLKRVHFWNVSTNRVFWESGNTKLLVSISICMLLSVTEHILQTIAIATMFLACKAEETPRRVSDVTVVAYKLVYRWDPSASRRIKQRVRRTFQLHLSGSLSLSYISRLDYLLLSLYRMFMISKRS